MERWGFPISSKKSSKPKKETFKLRIGQLLSIQLPPWQPLCGHCAAWELGLFFPSQNRKSIGDLT